METSKATCEEVQIYENLFKDLTFLQVLLNDFTEIFLLRTVTERSTPFSDTCLKFIVTFCRIVICFIGRNTPNTKFLDVANKEANNVMWYRR